GAGPCHQRSEAEQHLGHAESHDDRGKNAEMFKRRHDRDTHVPVSLPKWKQILCRATTPVAAPMPQQSDTERSPTIQSIASTPSCSRRLRWSFMALSASGEWLFQLVISPVTRSGSRERNDFVGLPRNFLS